MVFERAANQMDAVGEQGGRQCVAFVTLECPAVEGEPDRLIAANATAGGKSIRLSHRWAYVPSPPLGAESVRVRWGKNRDDPGNVGPNRDRLAASAAVPDGPHLTHRSALRGSILSAPKGGEGRNRALTRPRAWWARAKSPSGRQGLISNRPTRCRRSATQPCLYSSSPRPKSNSVTRSRSIMCRMTHAVSTVPGECTLNASSCASFSTVAVSYPRTQNCAATGVSPIHHTPTRAMPNAAAARICAGLISGYGSGSFQLRA